MGLCFVSYGPVSGRFIVIARWDGKNMKQIHIDNKRFCMMNE